MKKSICLVGLCSQAAALGCAPCRGQTATAAHARPHADTAEPTTSVFAARCRPHTWERTRPRGFIDPRFVFSAQEPRQPRPRSPPGSAGSSRKRFHLGSGRASPVWINGGEAGVTWASRIVGGGLGATPSSAVRPAPWAPGDNGTRGQLRPRPPPVPSTSTPPEVVWANALGPRGPPQAQRTLSRAGAGSVPTRGAAAPWPEPRLEKKRNQLARADPTLKTGPAPAL